jgi:TolB-like protein/Tfp pilus assembly protein PilF
VAIIAVVAALGMMAWRGGVPFGGERENPPSTSPSADPRSLAVLPFENRSPDRNDEYFSDGLTEELLHRLARLPRFRVAARTSSFAFKGKPVDVSEVAQQLKVEAIVSGSVRRAGDLLRVTVQVIDVANGRPIWSEVFERQSQDAFRVQDEIAEAIVQRLDPGGAAPVRQAGPSPEAFDLYLQGRHQWNRRTAEGAAAAIQLLTKAIALAPDYARAHAALAEAYAVMGFYDYLPPRTAFTKAREAANRAASLDPALAEVPNTLAYVALYHDWNLDLARREFTRAINLSPRYAVAHQWYANALTVAGQFQEAAAAMRQAQELDPLAPTPHAALGWVYLYDRDYVAAERQLRRTLEAHPQYPLAQLWLTQALEGQRRFDEALAAADDVLRLVPDDVVAQLLRARVLARLNRQAESRAVLAAVGGREAAGYVPAYPRALVLIALRDFDAAFALLDRALADRAHSIAFLRVDPGLDPIRADARFEELVTRASSP